jgi:DNA repair exonuclease SbcCD ATPase subunit
MIESKALELEKLGKASRRAAIEGGLGIAILIGSLAFAGFRLSVAQNKLAAANEKLSTIQDQVKELENAKAQKEADLASLEQRNAKARETADSLAQKIGDLQNQLNELEAAAPQTVRTATILSGARHSLADLKETSQQLQAAASTPLPSTSKKEVASKKEREGFEKLVAGDYDDATAAFQASEAAYPGYHMAYEIARLLRARKADLDDPAKRKDVFQIIINKYSYGGPPDLLKKLKDM